MKVLILCLPAIGDALMATPMISLLKKKKPEIAIDIACMFEGVRYIFANNKNVDHVYKLSLYNENPSKGLIQLVSLRKNKYDVSMLIFPSYRREYHIAQWLIGAKKRIAHRFQTGYHSECNFLDTDLITVDEKVHNMFNNLNMLKAFNIDWRKEIIKEEIKYDFKLNKTDINFGEKQIAQLGWRQNDIIGIHPGSTKSPAALLRRWPVENYAQIIKFLIVQKKKKVLIFSGPDEIDVGKKLHTLVNNPNNCKLINNLKFNDALGLLNQVNLLICNDNGFGHLAVALNKKIITLWASTNEKWSLPYNKKLVTLIRSKESKPWYRYDLKRYVPKDAVGGMEMITVNEVMHAIFPNTITTVRDEKTRKKYDSNIMPYHKNIVILNWRDPKHPLAGGAEISLLEHAKFWAKNGANVKWFASKFNNALNNEEINGIKIIRKGTHYTVHLWAYAYYIQKKFGHVDLIIDSFHFLPFFSFLYEKTDKIIALINEPAKNAWFKNAFFPLSLLGYLVEPLFFIPYKKVPFITSSESIAEELIKYNIDKKRINIINHGSEAGGRDRGREYKKEKNPILIYLAQISPDKGIEDAIKALSSVLQINSTAKLWVVGKAINEKYLAKIKNIIVNKKLEKNVSLFGFVSETYKNKLLAKAWILVHPSIREGWGLNVIEANAVGTPAVGYNVVGLKDSIKNNQTGLLVEKNSKALADGINKLITDKKLYQNMSNEGKKWAKNFNWEKSTQKSWDLITNALK